MDTHCHLERGQRRCWWPLSWLTARVFARHVQPRPPALIFLFTYTQGAFRQAEKDLEGDVVQAHIYATPLYYPSQLIIRSLIMYATNSSHESKSTSTNCSSFPSKVACMKHGDVAFSSPNLLFMYSSAFCRYVKVRKKLEQSEDCVPCRS
jgi:hypothetical protein